MSVAIVLGSAFEALDVPLESVKVSTRFGDVELFRSGDAWVVFRHGRPHQRLPNQIPYRAYALAMKSVGVQTVVVTSSVGLLDPDLPLGKPMIVGDLVWLDNRLPDGSACTVWPDPHPEQGHLVLQHPLFHPGLAQRVRRLAEERGIGLHPADVDFWYAPGPRTKTAAENRVLRSMGLQVNSMTLAPEVVLAAELGMSVVGIVVGHKPSGEGMGDEAVAQSLRDAKAAMRALVLAVLTDLETMPSENPIYRFEKHR